MRAALFLLVQLALTTTNAYMVQRAPTRRSAMTMKRGRGSFKKEIDGGSGGMGSSSSSGSGGLGGSGRNWIQVPRINAKSLPKDEGKVALIETQALQLVDRNTNPKGAVSVLKYGAETFCFSASCPSCKIPMTKAQVLKGNDESKGAPRIACDFCKSTYSLKTGDQLEAQQGSGMFGNIAKSLFSANNDPGPLPIYSLGEREGKVVISLNQK